MGKSLLEATEIPDLSAREKCVFVDARGGTDAHARYMQGHLEGAHFVDLETELSHKASDAAAGGRHPLPDPADFARLLTEIGITSTAVVIVYDDKNGANAAARFWWMMKACGHQRVYVVNGGWKAIMEAGLPVSTEETPRVRAEVNYPADRWQLPVVSMQEVEQACASPEHMVIDVREGYRYSGEGEPFDLVAGHIPGAVNFPFVDNLDGSGKFLPAEKLEKLYRPFIGSVKSENVIVHCGSGVTACHTLLALEEAGISGAGLYVGSWSEWSRNNKPVATGDL